MKLIHYFKEKWLIYVFLIFAFLFFLSIFILDNSLSLSSSNAKYLITIFLFLTLVFALLDLFIIKNRVARLKQYFDSGSTNIELDELFYPIDREIYNIINKNLIEYENFKTEIETKTEDEIEFITKWIHDIKVPISAMRLILDGHEEELPAKLYQNMDYEIALIEQSSQTVFYHIKSNSFYQDYIINHVSAKKMISEALKQYSNFFIYKNIKLNVSSESYKVLTDEKWFTYILSQIISNAVKYTQNSGEISIFMEKFEDQIKINIKNSGSGIAPKDIGQIFNKGYTSSDERKSYSSTGYGMYLSKKLCNMLGHHLSVKSTASENNDIINEFFTQFTITIYNRNNTM